MQAWRGLTILKESHLATYFQLVMLCLGRQEIRSTAVEAVQTGNFAHLTSFIESAHPHQLSRLAFHEFS
ncbi:hypothetical protein ACM43_11335 [Bradyrhizobium sp. CCBAU 45321]|uniref:Uncharacterized protein n=1 Tax=Bradyrhizobium yuanmingense TaxID=108015 RepID=A0A1C3XH46_9BRAD|nr:hypothetical protein [Bradyrhizobium yuanmingense]MDA9545046.1 hypothetical protein [Bradyrhizobium sp. CCBAU 45321]TWI18293.1 hypothetical protein IQ15_07182 [Bradyrhizobium yuanmingense]SCB51590.1 hypothetical protein GA0061099_102010 [Bradyrhizobium yuanmingense]